MSLGIFLYSNLPPVLYWLGDFLCLLDLVSGFGSASKMSVLTGVGSSGFMRFLDSKFWLEIVRLMQVVCVLCVDSLYLFLPFFCYAELSLYIRFLGLGLRCVL